MAASHVRRRRDATKRNSTRTSRQRVVCLCTAAWRHNAYDVTALSPTNSNINEVTTDESLRSRRRCELGISWPAALRPSQFSMRQTSLAAHWLAHRCKASPPLTHQPARPTYAITDAGFWRLPDSRTNRYNVKGTATKRDTQVLYKALSV